MNTVPATTANLRAIGIAVEHHFGGKAYIKATHVPAGRYLEQHAHPHDHLSVLVSGTVRLVVDGETRELTGYQTLTIEAHKQHGIYAVTDCIWLCVWGTDCEDPDVVDTVILKGD